jgi:hypothetical protein
MWERTYLKGEQDIIRCGWSDLRGELKDMIRERMA